LILSFGTRKRFGLVPLFSQLWWKYLCERELLRW